MVCGYDNGQVLLFTGEGSNAAFDRLLASFGQEDLPRSPVNGLGDGASALFYDPENPYQDHGAFVVFGAGPPTVAVTVYAEEGEPAGGGAAPSNGRRAGDRGKAAVGARRNRLWMGAPCLRSGKEASPSATDDVPGSAAGGSDVFLQRDL